MGIERHPLLRPRDAFFRLAGVTKPDNMIDYALERLETLSRAPASAHPHQRARATRPE